MGCGALTKNNKDGLIVVGLASRWASCRHFLLLSSSFQSRGVLTHILTNGVGMVPMREFGTSKLLKGRRDKNTQVFDPI